MHLAFHAIALPSSLAFLHPRTPTPAATSSKVTLARHTTLRLHRPLGRTVECLSGCVWITQDGDTRDLVLTTGQRYQANCNQRALVHALEDSHVRILG